MCGSCGWWAGVKLLKVDQGRPGVRFGRWTRRLGGAATGAVLRSAEQVGHSAESICDGTQRLSVVAVRWLHACRNG